MGGSCRVISRHLLSRRRQAKKNSPTPVTPETVFVVFIIYFRLYECQIVKLASSGASERGSAPTLEQVLGEFFVKGAHTVLSARLNQGPARRGFQPVKKRTWFNFDVDEVESASKELERWRRDPGLPLVVEIFLRPWGHDEQRLGRLAGTPGRVETLLERWVFHHHQVLPDSPSTLSKSALARLSPSAIYKRLVILVRSVYALLRTLPAHKLCRTGARDRRVGFTVAYRLHSSLPHKHVSEGAPKPLSIALAASETPYGRLHVSVEYRAASAIRVLEQTARGAAPKIIFDYFGSHGFREDEGTSDRGFSRSAPRVAFAEEAVHRAGARDDKDSGRLLTGSLEGGGDAVHGGILMIGSAGSAPAGSFRSARSLPKESTPFLEGDEAGVTPEESITASKKSQEPTARLTRVATLGIGSGGQAVGHERPLYPPPASPGSHRSTWSSSGRALLPSRSPAGRHQPSPSRLGSAVVGTPQRGTTPPSSSHGFTPERPAFSPDDRHRHEAITGDDEIHRDQQPYPERPGMSSPMKIPGADQRLVVPLRRADTGIASGYGGSVEEEGSRRSVNTTDVSMRGNDNGEDVAVSRADGVVARVVGGSVQAVSSGSRMMNNSSGLDMMRTSSPSSSPNHQRRPSSSSSRGGMAGADDDVLLLMMAPTTSDAALSTSSGTTTGSRAAAPFSCSPPSFPFALTPSGASSRASSSLPRGFSGQRPGSRGNVISSSAPRSSRGMEAALTNTTAMVTVGSTPRHGSSGSFRRPSWSSSSLRGSGALLGPSVGSGPFTVGYSVSPLQDTALEALLLRSGVPILMQGTSYPAGDDMSTLVPSARGTITSVSTVNPFVIEKSASPQLDGFPPLETNLIGGASDAQLSGVRVSSTADDDLSLDALPFVLEPDTPADGGQSGGARSRMGGGPDSLVDHRTTTSPTKHDGHVDWAHGPLGMASQTTSAHVYVVSGGGWNDAMTRSGTQEVSRQAPDSGGAVPAVGYSNVPEEINTATKTPTQDRIPQDLDVAVGALVRLLRDAPPLGAQELTEDGGLTVAEGLSRLQELTREFNLQSAW